MSQTLEQVIELSQAELLEFCGTNDARLREIETQFEVRIIPRGNTLKLMGSQEEVARAASLIHSLVSFQRGKQTLSKRQRRYAMESIRENRGEDLHRIFGDRVSMPRTHRSVSPMTAGQKRYLDAIRSHDIVFGIGPAGTGKTYLAVAMAVSALAREQVARIILTRPAVEAGEKLGFLPGDMAQKVDPYLRPLTDALNDMMGQERAAELAERAVIEVAPLAFMRGRTLNNAFIILDEAQNTTREQMKMFLTRIGFDSRAVITGDVTQIDLPGTQKSGLIQAERILTGIKGIAFRHFSKADVVRHPLVQEIIHAYEQQSGSRRTPAPAGKEE